MLLKPRPALIADTDKRKVELRTQALHGRTVSYRIVGEEPPILFVHGITNEANTWMPVLELLASRGEGGIAPDLPGHGASDRHRGDHSLGAHACILRDLLAAVYADRERFTVVGHSLGGGIAMQFSYQFPELVERLVLIDSGGLGREVSPLLRAATLPGADPVIAMLGSRPLAELGMKAGQALEALRLAPGAELKEVARGIASLGDEEHREAFLRTVRQVLSPFGQRINATDRLYLTEEVPTLFVWGARDPIIPLAHGETAHAAAPNSRLEVFEHSGHFPHLDEPERFVEVLLDFIATTEPAEPDRERLRKRLLKGPPSA
ncbi:MAG: alpha/beta fold hydrolase [Solirubrobacterales bacterium]